MINDVVYFVSPTRHRLYASTHLNIIRADYQSFIIA